MVKKGVSVISCCYNSASRIPETLKYLSLQEGTENIPWEIIIINNASTDDTVKVANEEWHKYGIPDVDFKIVDQTIPGLSNAREKGIKESKYEYLLFCDDDNWLNSNYIKLGFEIFNNQPEVAIIGGFGIEAPEINPPKWFEKYKLSYAVGAHSSQSGDITISRGDVYGAGALFRKSILILLYQNGFKSILSDRKGKDLTSGGDNELCICIKLLGFKIWYCEDLKFFHFIPKDRLTIVYLLRLQKGIAKSFCLLRPYYFIILNSKLSFDKRSQLKKTWLWFAIPRLISFLLSKALFKSIYFRTTNYIDDEIINAECQLEYLKALISQKNKVLYNYKMLKQADWYKNRIQLFEEYKKTNKN